MAPTPRLATGEAVLSPAPPHVVPPETRVESAMRAQRPAGAIRGDVERAGAERRVLEQQGTEHRMPTAGAGYGQVPSGRSCRRPACPQRRAASEAALPTDRRDAFAHHRRQRLGRQFGDAGAESRRPRSRAPPAASRARRSSKWVKPWRTSPAAAPGARASGRARRHSASGPGFVAPGRAGQLGHAAEQPARRAAAQQHLAAPRRSARNARRGAPARCRLRALRGRSAAMPRRRPSQARRQGQSAQAGVVGVQIVAPRSNSAWAKSPGRARPPGPCRGRPPAAAMAPSAAGSGSSIGEQRGPPRARHCRPPAPPACPNAIAATAAAV